MFTVKEREQVQRRVLRLAAEDRRIVAGAVVGSLALTSGDRWSDLDLTFGVRAGSDLLQVLDDWTEVLQAELRAVVLFDLASGPSIYRVLLLPGSLQVDLSVTPAAQFGPRGETFRLLFGHAQPATASGARPVGEIFGHAVHHAVRARVALERDRPLQAEYWLTELRREVLTLVCRRHGLPVWQARGADQLPEAVVASLSEGIVRSLDRPELLRALRSTVRDLLAERAQAARLAGAVAAELEALVEPD